MIIGSSFVPTPDLDPNVITLLNTLIMIHFGAFILYVICLTRSFMRDNKAQESAATQRDTKKTK